MSKNEPKEEKAPVEEKKAEVKETTKKETAKETKTAKTAKAKKETVNENKEEVKEVKNEEVEKEEVAETAKAPKKEAVKKEVEVKEEPKQEKFESKKDESKKKSGKKGIIITSILVLVAAIVAVVLWLVLGTKTIDLSDCLDIKYEGYNDHATAKVEINEKKLKDKIGDSSIAKKFKEKATLEIQNNENLSNGNELTVKVKISSSFLEDKKLKLKDSTIKIKIEGIEEALSLDMSKYIKVEYKGSNKHAIAEVTLMTEEMEDDLGEAFNSTFTNRINFEVKNNENLENGDELEIKVIINEAYLQENGLALASDTVKVKVEGLKDAEELDAFKDIKIDISGMSPNLSLSISNNSEDEFLKTVQYKASKTSGIANGETITITAIKWDEELADEKNVTLKETKMEYTVSGQSAYIFTKSEITDAVKNELKTIFVSKATSKANEKSDYYSTNFKYQLYNNTDYKYSGISDNMYGDAMNKDLTIGTPEVVSMYLLTKKDGSNANYINTITAIIKVPAKSARTGATYNWYITIDAANVSLKQDGTVSDNTNYIINVEDGNDEEKAYQSYINAYKNKYNVEKITL